MYVVVTVGLIYSAAFAMFALWRGRTKATRKPLWIIAIVILSMDVAFHIAMSVGVLLNEPGLGGWVVVGTTAIAGLLLTAIWQPRLAGQALLGSALLMPLALWLVSALPWDLAADLVPLPVILGLWSTRAIIIGILLIASQPRMHPETAVSA